ncbi:MAG: hypothetical protein K6F52_07015 [Clostridia bacterium]|nr:hypothetical protein [Clostridia bacterium]
MPKQALDKFCRIIRGELSYTSSNLAVNLLLSRLTKQYKQDPSSMDSCIEQLNEFAKKYAAFMEKEYLAVNNL